MTHEQPALFDVQPEQAPFEYELLVGHDRSDGSFKSSEQLRSEYVHLTDDLVYRITNGVQVVDYETGERTTKPVDSVVWLDKSARPLAWLMKDLWPTLAANKDGVVPKMPDSRFVNIDRNQWTSSIDPEGQGVSDVGNIDPSIIRSLRSIFLSNPRDRDNGITPAIDTAATQFDGKTILIVDELLSSGRTLTYAEKFFKRAFPQTNVATAHWMGGVIQRNGAIGNADKPVWYSDETYLGRGIGNRNIDLSLKSTNNLQRLGAWFLSNALREPDPLSIQLRAELHQLAEDTKNGSVIVEPSRERDYDDFVERATRFNHVDSIQEYQTLRKSLHNS